MAEFLRSLTPEFFDTVIIVIIIIGLAAAVVRLYADFTRKLPPMPTDDTQPTAPEKDGR
ncbi:MAG: hypothetical protein SF123_12405 [Chloroflexota bacterium]|nr:hypothetical protein [Chloroflexota bacterium]